MNHLYLIICHCVHKILIVNGKVRNKSLLYLFFCGNYRFVVLIIGILKLYASNVGHTNKKTASSSYTHIIKPHGMLYHCMASWYIQKPTTSYEGGYKIVPRLNIGTPLPLLPCCYTMTSLPHSTMLLHNDTPIPPYHAATQ